MAPKRGDKKVQNGVTYRYGSRNGKLQWIKSNEGLNLVGATGKKLKKIRDQISGGVGKAYNKAFGNPKTDVNKKYKAKTWKKKPNEKLATWREDSTENKKLQQERKSGSDETYSRKTTNNNKKKVVNKKGGGSSSSSGKKMGSIEKKNRKIHGDTAINKLKIKHADWKKARKEGKLDEWKKKYKKKK
tara:strand:- start:494 stop:1054 length:561 start_codon:yes stop_codon:yes gene_type:complete